MNTPANPVQTEVDAVHDALSVSVFALASLAEMRDSDTGNHILRVQHYVMALAQQARQHPRFTADLTEAYIQSLFQAAPLCDMGTIGIPDRILLKPGRLTAAEIDIMRTHTTLAHEAIVQAEKMLGYPSQRLQTLKEITFCHHEKWNGGGYPRGLSGEQIPLSARLIAIADVFDALISDRVYKAGVSHDKAVEIIAQGRGSHFDPDLVDAFLEIQGDFLTIARRYADTDQDMQKKIEYMINAIAEEVVEPVMPTD